MGFAILLMMVAAASAALLHYIVTRAKVGMPYPLWVVWTLAQGAMSISALVAGLSQFAPDAAYGVVALKALLIAFIVREACVLLFHYFFRGCERRIAAREWSPFGCVALLALGVVLLTASPAARAQDGRHGVGHAQHHEWYRTLISPQTGASCCNNEDCRPTRAYVDGDGAWHALLDGQWIRVPREKVLNTRTPDGNSHICANQFGMIFCFVGGVPKS